MTTRRAFLGTLAGGLLAASLAAEAQQPARVPRIGVLTNAQDTPEFRRFWDPFRQGLRERGWVEGQNIVIEWRYTEGKPELFPGLAAELVSLKVDLILASTTPGVRAAKQATSTIPIVMTYVLDPVGAGLVAGLARPGGNVTGVTYGAGPEIVGKYLELLKEAVPKLSRVAVLLAPDPVSPVLVRETRAAAQALGVNPQLLEVRNPDEFEGAFAAMRRERADGLLVAPHTFTFVHARRIIELAAASRLPTVYAFREPVEAGGLMGYGANAPDMFRRAAIYVDKILKGANPADLPVEQPTKFDLVINVKTAKVLGLTIPQSLLLRADEVIR